MSKQPVRITRLGTWRLRFFKTANRIYERLGSVDKFEPVSGGGEMGASHKTGIQIHLGGQHCPLLGMARIGGSGDAVLASGSPACRRKHESKAREKM